MKNNSKIWIGSGIAAILLGIGLLFSLRGRKRIVKFSESLIGQQETVGNLGFDNKNLEEAMANVGWSPGDAWCVYSAKLVWYLMAPDFLQDKIMKKVVGSSQQTWENLKNDSSFKISAVPKTGSMAIWQTYRNGVPQSTGHAGIVKKLGYGGEFISIEGNTNDFGGAEGYIIADKTRTINYKENNGLRLKGFVTFA